MKCVFRQDDDISKPEEDGEAAQDLTVSAELKQHISNLGLTAVAKQGAVFGNHEEWKQSERMEQKTKQNNFASVQGNHEVLKQPERMEQEEEEEDEEEEEEMPEDLTERRQPSVESYQFAAEVPRRPDEEESIAE